MGHRKSSTASVERVAVDGACEACGASALERYPVVSEGGWFMVTKCTACLTAVAREPWNRLGNVVRHKEFL